MNMLELVLEPVVDGGVKTSDLVQEVICNLWNLNEIGEQRLEIAQLILIRGLAIIRRSMHEPAQKSIDETLISFVHNDVCVR